MLLMLGCKLFPKIEHFVEQRPLQLGLERKTVDIVNGQMSYWEGGNLDGEPLVWLHGFGGDAMWAYVRNVPNFADDYHIIAPDLIGFGESSGNATLNAQVDALLAVLSVEDINRAHFVGLSYGGFVGLKMLPTDRVQSLTLIGVGGVGWSETEFNTLAQRFEVPDLPSLFVPKSTEDTRKLVDICFHIPTVLVPKSFDAELFGNVFGRHPEAQRALLWNLQEEASNVTMWTTRMTEQTPTLLIVGRQDPIFSIEDVQELKQILSGEMLIYPLADHVPQVGYRRKFNRDLKMFLSQHTMMPSIEHESME